MSNTTTSNLTLFSVRADFMGCEYGSLFIVAANDSSEAERLVVDRLDRGSAAYAVEVESCDPIGTTDRFDGPMVVEQFTT